MLIYAHRGYSAKYPENTRSAFVAALPHVDGIELDVQLSKDGRLVVIHDETVDRTTNGSGEVKAMTLKELRALSIEGQERIPTLEEVLALVQRADVTLNIELKTDREPYPGIERLAWLAVEEFELTHRVVFSSFNPETLWRLRQLAPDARIALLIGERLENKKWVEQLGIEAIHAQPAFLESPEWETLHEQGMKIRLYTINDSTEWPSQTVDAIMTDEVERFSTKQQQAN